MSQNIKEPMVMRAGEVPMFGPGHDESHYISVPIQQYYSLDGVGNVGVCHMEPGDETVVFGIETEDDGTAPHHYGPCDEFYYVLDGEFTVWWGTDAAALDNHFVLHPGDCTHYTTGWKYKVKNTGDGPARFFYFLTNPPGIERRFD
ncbi:MAG: cupin domain-containing protein [Rhodospirillaceae bacterium]|jgi:mannose-6-phosphate isomerase-like protein (cupin superfamily)|nr:cupin domain-containing protein [Rhodospirillaceae bacterium]MBT4489212.1 cupin domain-containing protein [Rhodospirillaceae bacterium]MBT5191660.1 cupin domain-containing protein [Rhodospirillaceae bacterium]MBT5898038.1 cupin domain-containing protein [Rhodospirillaceae bacterium]MBT7756541.1 cupin domain-containing protein [Rhodospirillaceae bacterium]